MSQDYIFNFSHGFERSSAQDQQQHHLTHQIRRDKLRLQGFEPPPPSLVGLEEVDEGPGGGVGLPGVFETGAGMLSEMFNFPTGESNSTTELLVNQINYQQQHRNQRPSTAADWYGNSAQAMQLFLTNPSHESPSSQSPSHHHHHNPSSSSSTLHMLLPNTVHSANSTLHHQQSFGSTTGTGQGHFGPSTQFTWVPPGGTAHEGEGVGGVVDNQGLSLSLSSTLQHLEAAKVEDLRIGDDSAAAGMLYFNQVGGGDPYRNLHMQGGGGGGVMGQTQHPIHIGFGSSSLGVVKVLRNSRYARAAQELLEEFCSVGRSQFKKNKSGSKHNNPNNPNQNPSNSGGGGGASSSSKDLPPLSSAERIEHQRRKVKLSSMLDEASQSLSLSLSLPPLFKINPGRHNIPATNGCVLTKAGRKRIGFH